MKAFHCERCHQLVFFENSRCVTCGSTLASVPETRRMASRGLRLCRNYETHEVCNWSVAADDDNPLCRSCRLTRVIPDLSEVTRVARWHSRGRKRRLIVTLAPTPAPIPGKTGPRRGRTAYPFVLSSTAIEKLAFVHRVITRAAD